LAAARPQRRGRDNVVVMVVVVVVVGVVVSRLATLT
jgi:hypothetical protein